MKILLIEDDPDWAESIRSQLDIAVPHNELTVADTREAAFDRLARLTYDLILCDLKIPPDASGVDPEISHGVAVLDRIELACPGTRVIVLSGFGDLDILQPFMTRHGPADYFGTGRMWVMRDHVRKNNVDRLLDELQEFGAEHREVEDVELNGAVVADLSPEEVRVVRAFARRHGGQTVHVESLNEGRSSARTLRVEVRNQADARCHLAVAKLDEIGAVRDEGDRYLRRIHPLLPIGTYTDWSGEVTVGAGSQGGCFYKLLEGYDTSLFGVLRADPVRGAEVVDALRRNLSQWCDNAAPASKRLAELRHQHAPADVLTAPCLVGLPCAREELRAVAIHLGTGHCDLHGGNILVNVEGKPVVIDYARAAEASVVFDPVTLELSAVCHPDASLALAGWPADAQWASWFDLETFVAGSPIEGFVRACRGWAESVRRGDRELLTCAYTYLLRQIQYGHVPDSTLSAAIGGILDELGRR